MTLPPELRRQLSRMEKARRQTQRQLDMVGRQITRRMMALIPSLLPRRTHYRRGRSPDPGAFLERVPSSRLDRRVPTGDRRPVALAWQDQAIARFLDRHGEFVDISERVQRYRCSAEMPGVAEDPARASRRGDHCGDGGDASRGLANEWGRWS